MMTTRELVTNMKYFLMFYIVPTFPLTSSTGGCFFGCLKLNLCFQGLGGFSGPGVENIVVSGSLVALVALSELLLFMPLYLSMLALVAGHNMSEDLSTVSSPAKSSQIRTAATIKSTGLWRLSKLRLPLPLQPVFV